MVSKLRITCKQTVSIYRANSSHMDTVGAFCVLREQATNHVVAQTRILNEFEEGWEQLIWRPRTCNTTAQQSIIVERFKYGFMAARTLVWQHVNRVVRREETTAWRE